MRNAAAGAALLSVGLLLSACGGGDDGPEVLPPITPTPAVTSAAPSPSVSAFPDTPQGAAAFARFFYRTVNAAYSQKAPELLVGLGDASCEACQRYVSTARRLQAGSVSIESNGLQVLSAESPGQEPDGYAVVLRIKGSGAVFRDPAGVVTIREPAGEAEVEMRLARSGSSWKVLKIFNVALASSQP